MADYWNSPTFTWDAPTKPWTPPKLNWGTDLTALTHEDLNRLEGNIQHMYEYMYSRPTRELLRMRPIAIGTHRTFDYPFVKQVDLFQLALYDPSTTRNHYFIDLGYELGDHYDLVEVGETLRFVNNSIVMGSNDLTCTYTRLAPLWEPEAAG